MALSRARELGFKTVACASTGNLANSVAANAASAGLKSYVLIPADLEQGKVLGSLVYGTKVIGIHGAYDQVNRLCSEIAGKYGWGFVNVNLRPYYAEGSKIDGLRDRRATRLAPAAAHRGADGLAARCSPRSTRRTRSSSSSAWSTNDALHRHGAQATGCAPDLRTPSSAGRTSSSPCRSRRRS